MMWERKEVLCHKIFCEFINSGFRVLHIHFKAISSKSFPGTFYLFIKIAFLKKLKVDLYHQIEIHRIVHVHRVGTKSIHFSCLSIFDRCSRYVKMYLYSSCKKDKDMRR